jgi:hypothetical protein
MHKVEGSGAWRPSKHTWGMCVALLSVLGMLPAFLLGCVWWQRPFPRGFAGMVVVEVPGDGDCCFHALARGGGAVPGGRALRAFLARFVRNNPRARLGGARVGDLIRREANMSTRRYARALKGGRLLGGILEIALYARALRRRVHVYAGDDCALVATCGVAGPLQRVVWWEREGHYDMLEGDPTHGVAAPEYAYP